MDVTSFCVNKFTTSRESIKITCLRIDRPQQAVVEAQKLRLIGGLTDIPLLCFVDMILTAKSEVSA